MSEAEAESGHTDPRDQWIRDEDGVRGTLVEKPGGMKDIT